MSWLSPKLQKYVLLPIAAIGAFVFIGLRNTNEKPVGMDHPYGYEEPDLKHSEHIREMTARTIELSFLMEQVTEGEVTLKEATSRFNELNRHNRGFKVYRELGFRTDSAEIGSSLMLLRRVKTHLVDNPEKLSEVSARLEAEFETTFGIEVPEVIENFQF
jgi:hypothetical protein